MSQAGRDPRGQGQMGAGCPGGRGIGTMGIRGDRKSRRSGRAISPQKTLPEELSGRALRCAAAQTLPTGHGPGPPLKPDAKPLRLTEGEVRSSFPRQ